MLDALIIIMACASEAPSSCVPFMVHKLRVERPADCQEPTTELMRMFASKAPGDIRIRGVCMEDPNPPIRPNV